MNQHTKYAANDRMGELICENYNLLLVMSRFGLSLGFGDKTVRQVCEEQGVHTETFLAVVNFIYDSCYSHDDFKDDISIPALIEYLRQSHVYFLKFKLPTIRRELIEAIDLSGGEVSLLIIRFFDEYAKEVKAHMDYENTVVFEYVTELLKGKLSEDYNITYFADRHDNIEVKLSELKNIIVKYYPANSDNNALNNVLFDIYSCEEDLEIHRRVEDDMFIPLIKDVENKVKKNA